MLIPHISKNVLSAIMINTEDSLLIINDLGLGLQNSIVKNSVS